MASTVPPPPGAGAPVTPPPAGPPGTAGASPLNRVDFTALGRLDWMGPLRVSSTILGVSGILAVLIGLGLRPGLPGLHWDLRTTLVFFGWLWASAFGADMTAKIGVGGVSANAGLGTFALTITIISLAAGAWLFRRYTAGLRKASSVIWFAVRTAVMTAIPPTIVSWFLYADLGSILHLANQGLNGFFGSGGDANVGHLKVGFSSMGSFFLTLLLTLVTLLAVTLVRPGLFTGAVEKVRSYLAGPILGAGIFLGTLIPAGLLAAVLLWAFHFGGSGSGSNLTWHEWMNLIALAIAYAPNLALWELGLGAGAKIHGGASTSLGDASVSSDKGLKFWSSTDTGVNHGVWFAVVLTPVLLALTAYLLVRLSSRYDLTEQRKRLGTWLVSLLIFLPFFFHFASIHGHAQVTGLQHATDAGNGMLSGLSYFIGDASMLPNRISGSVVAGPAALAVFLVFVYAAVISLLVAWGTGVLTRESVAGLRSKLAYQPAGTASGNGTAVPGAHAAEQYREPLSGPYTASQAPVAGPTGQPVSYQVGDVVNGWRWTGAEWVPADR